MPQDFAPAAGKCRAEWAVAVLAGEGAALEEWQPVDSIQAGRLQLETDALCGGIGHQLLHFNMREDDIRFPLQRLVVAAFEPVSLFRWTD